MTPDSRLKVVFVINGLGPGGAERSIAELLPEYIRRDVSPRVVCLSQDNTTLQRVISGSGVPITFLRSKAISRAVPELVKFLRAWEPDLVVTTLFEADLIGRLAGRATGTRTLTSLVNTANSPARRHDPHISSWKLAFVQSVDGVMARRMTSHFHAITEAVKSDALVNYRIDGRSVSVIPRGRDPHRLGRPSSERRSTTRTALGFSEATPVVLMVGRQEYQKGHRHLLEALPEISTHVPDVRVWLAGRSGAQTSTICSTIRSLKLDDRVEVLGHREDVPDLMAAADVLVFPSLYEGLGGTLIEALALELPIVASDIPAIREVTDDGRCATLVPAGDSSALAEAVIRILLNPESVTARTVAGRRRFEALYTIDRIGEQMVGLMRDVATGNVTPRDHGPE